MKKISILSVVSALCLVLLFINGCRKPKDPPKPKDPCDSKVLVKALEHIVDADYCGQFEYTDPSNVTTWLYAVNWSSYKDKVVPGGQYHIAYKEVDCSLDPDINKERDWMRCGCFGPQRKCIKLLCLEPVRDCGTSNCLPTEMNPPDYGDKFTHFLEGISIKGDVLNAKLGYSGCGSEEIKNFRLVLQETRFRCPTPKLDRVFLARAVTDNNMICQAYFEKETCFDLAALRSYMIAENFDMSKSVVIRLEKRDGSNQDITYQP